MNVRMAREVQKLRKRGLGYLRIAKRLTKKHGRPVHQKSVFRWARYEI